MNVTLPKKEKINTNSIVIYTIAIVTCIIAVIIILLVRHFGSSELDRIVTVGGSSITKEEEEYQQLLDGFDDIFQNKLEGSASDITINKIDDEKEIVYTYYTNYETSENDYELNLNIPYINIDSDIIENINEEIKTTFENKAESTLKSENQNIIYSLEYEAIIENNILYVVIRSNLKESSNAQRDILRTYCYDLENNKEVSLAELLTSNGRDISEVEAKIKEEIMAEQRTVETLEALGYEIYERNPDDEMYLVENTEEFFMKDGNIYIIYAYGNHNYTSELDVIIV